MFRGADFGSASVFHIFKPLKTKARPSHEATTVALTSPRALRYTISFGNTCSLSPAYKLLTGCQEPIRIDKNARCISRLNRISFLGRLCLTSSSRSTSSLLAFLPRGMLSASAAVHVATTMLTSQSIHAPSSTACLRSTHSLIFSKFRQVCLTSDMT